MNKSFVSAIKNLNQRVKKDILSTKSPVYVDSNLQSESICDTGAVVDLQKGMFESHTKKTRNLVSLAPKSSVLIKKKYFTTLASSNDLKWMSSLEKFFLRSVKALFAYKVQQIRVYESLTKFENFYQDYNVYNLNLLARLNKEARKLLKDGINAEDDIASLIVDSFREVPRLDDKQIAIMELLRRNVYATDNTLTTWIVDQEKPDEGMTGPGTGVIEMTLFNSFSVNLGLDSSPKSGSMSFVDPYNISMITEDDIKFAITEAATGKYGLFQSLLEGAFQERGVLGSIKPTNYTDVSNLEQIQEGLSFDFGDIDFGYITNRLRKFFLGKPFIDPSDGIHIFVNSNKTTFDYGAKNVEELGAVDDQEIEISDIVLEAERRLFFNNKINFEEYKKLRRYSSDSFSMQHIFAGYITSTSISYSSGSYNLNVKYTDNMGWLNWSRFVTEPALADYVGILEDPLTPFKTSFDELGDIKPGTNLDLLDENKQLLDLGILSYKSGLFRGQNASEQNLFQGEFNGVGSNKGSKILQHPDGFIYRWKDGVVTQVADFQNADPSGSSYRKVKTHIQQHGLSAAEQPLVNLDIANILSILITGQPYDVEKFLKNSFEAHNLSKKSTASRLNQGQSDPLSFIINSIRKQNKYYGNFKPYRMITMNKRSIQRSITDIALKESINNTLKDLQKRKIQVRTQIRLIKETVVDPARNARNNILIGTLTVELNNIEASIKNQLRIARNSGIIEEKDIRTFDFNFLNPFSNLDFDGDDEFNESVTRAMMRIGAKRRIEDVRLNRDKNYFIISDQYDYNVDLKPFLLNIRNSNFKLFEGTYTNVFERCQAANNIIKFEFFCNSDGNLEFRPPQWNKTPLTVLQESAKLTAKGRKSAIPGFITKTFENRISALSNDIQTLNLSIVIGALLLGRFPDRTLIPGMEKKGASALKFFGVSAKGAKKGDNSIAVLSLARNGNQTLETETSNVFDLNADISVSEYGEVFLGDTETLLGQFDPIFQEENSVLDNVLNVVENGSSVPAFKYATVENINRIIEDYEKRVGVNPAARLGIRNRSVVQSDFVFGVDLGRNSEGLENVLKEFVSSEDSVLEKIKNILSERDRLVTILNRNKEKSKELEEVNQIILTGNSENPTNADKIFTEGFFKNNPGIDISGQTIDTDSSNKASEKLDNAYNSLSILSGSADKGAIFDHMIEDNTVNLEGYGSGKRFIIEDIHILSATYTHDPPDFTRIDVVGDAPLKLGSVFQSATDGKYYWAGATDFDMWRQYGYKPFRVEAPYLSDSELQCKPFALMNLSIQKSKILKANINLVGNEFYKPGEVVFVKSTGLLYYIESVNHNFSYGQQFTTSLSLSYGHPPGEYLPTPLDVIGQQISTEPLKDRVLNYRKEFGDDEYTPLRPDSSILFPSLGRVTKSTVLDFADNQSRFANMMVDLGGSILTSNRYLLLRVFVNASPDKVDLVREKANEILFQARELFTNPEMITNAQQPEINLATDFNKIPGAISDAFFSSLSNSGIPISAFSEVGDKKLEPLVLPNGIIPTPIKPNKILMQISFLKKVRKEKPKVSEGQTNERQEEFQGDFNSSIGLEEDESGPSDYIDLNDEIICLNNELADVILDNDGVLVNDKDQLMPGDQSQSVGKLSDVGKRLFPSGGPSQESWSDLRTLFGNVGLGFLPNTVSRIVEVGIIDLTKVVKK